MKVVADNNFDFKKRMIEIGKEGKENGYLFWKTEEYMSMIDMVDYLEDLDAPYAANASLDATYTISWAWSFSVDTATDKLDTELSDGVDSASKKYVKSFEFGVAVSVEQTQA